jgi:hypothetical protein
MVELFVLLELDFHEEDRLLWVFGGWQKYAINAKGRFFDLDRLELVSMMVRLANKFKE